MKVWELRQALAELEDDALVVLRVRRPPGGWPTTMGWVDADLGLYVEAEDLDAQYPSDWGRPAMQLVDGTFDPEKRPYTAEPVHCAVLEAWPRDGDGR